MSVPQPWCQKRSPPASPLLATFHTTPQGTSSTNGDPRVHPVCPLGRLTVKGPVEIGGIVSESTRSEIGSLGAAIEMESHTQLFVRMTTQNFEEATRARKEGRKPSFQD